VDAGVTQVAIDASAVAPEARARVLAELGEPTLERGIALDVVVDLGAASQRAARAVPVLDELRRAGVVPAVVSVRCPAAPDADAARAQAGALGRIAAAVGGIPIMRRGPVGEEILAAVALGPVRLVDDGGAAEARAEAALPAGLAPGGPARRGQSALDRAASSLDAEGVDRLEVRAYLETTVLLERLGLPGAAPGIAHALERRLRTDG
jgi:hypothetical protein